MNLNRTSQVALFVSLGVVGSSCAAGLTPQLKQHITGKVESQRPALEACYTRALSLNPTLQADLLVAFEIQADSNRFRSVRLKKGAGVSPGLERCLVEALREITLDQRPDVRILSELPVRFTPMARMQANEGVSNDEGLEEDDEDEGFGEDEGFDDDEAYEDDEDDLK